MINAEKMFLSAEEQEQDEMEEEKEDDEEEEATSSDDNNDEEGEGEKEAEPSSAAEEKKPSDVPNLNNEVVKMRKEVKRVKALIIRKLTRQIVALKKKKGKEAEMERNQRRAARLLEEVHSMKKLPPDGVTKAALGKNLNFERVCKNPKSTMLDRAVARIASHPQFRKKIESIRAAVKDFREERTKARKQGEHPEGRRQPEIAAQLSPDTRQTEDKEKNDPLNQQVEDIKEGEDVLKSARKSVVQSPATPDVHKQEMPESTCTKSTVVKSSTKPKPESKREETDSRPQSVPELALESTDEEESDEESSDDEEKEYFDDSTEERFHKQSSASEESDEDDFFIGKVSKFKKKKKEMSGGVEVDKEQGGKGDPGNPKTDKLQSELDELESRLKSKPMTVQSVFCSKLSGSKGGRGGDKGKGTGTSGAPGNSKTGGGLHNGGSGKLKFAKQENRTSNAGAKFGKRPGLDRREPGSAGRGRGKDVRKQKDNRGGGFLSRQPALHPSWEASKKRKEQQGQILAFQGKKIKFDDDDD